MADVAAPFQHPLSTFACPKPDCPRYGQRDAGNIQLKYLSGLHRNIRTLWCTTCRRSFSERTGTAFENCKLPIAKAIAVFEHLKDGNGTRQTSRLVKVRPNTVTAYARRAGAHAHATHDERVAFSPSDARGSGGREVELRGRQGGAQAARPPRSRRPR